MVTYNTPPTNPSSLAVSPCVGACSPATTPSLTPTLSATSTDNDGGTLTYTFDVTTPTGTEVATGTATAAAGSPAGWTVPAGKLSDESSYQFTVSVSDGTDSAGPSGAFAFATDTDKPPATPTGFTETPCKPTLCADKVPAGTPPTVMSLSPVLSATLEDPDTPLNSLYGDFQVREVGSGTNLAVGSAQPDTTSGISSFTVPGGLLTDGGHYEFRVGDRDPTSTTWSDWVAFDVALDQIATIPTLAMSPCLSGCGSWGTDTTTPNFTAQSDDADDSTITYHFEIQKPDGTAVVSGKLTDQTPGEAVVWKTPVGNLSAGSYQIRVGAADDVQEGADAISWTGFAPFAVQYPATTPTNITSCPAITSHVIWNQAGSPYVLHCTQVVSGGGELELQPGTVVKMASGTIDVRDGQLNAHGSADYPIVFTSYADDSQLGDTNGDGDTTSPAPGNWSTAITVGDISSKDAASSTPESTIKNVAFIYGGRNGGGFGGGCHGAGQVIKVDRWGRVVVDHDDFAQLSCNAFSVDEQSDGIGSTIIKNSYVEPTVGYAAFDQVLSGVIKDNVLDSYATLDTWTSSTTWGLTMTGNYMVGNMRVESSGAASDILGIHDNSLFMNGEAQEPWGVNDMDLRNNWWGFVPTAYDQEGTYDGRAYGCSTRDVPAINWSAFNFCGVSGLPGQATWLIPNQGYENQIVPALTSPPPFPDAGLEAHPASLAVVDPEGLYGTSPEFAQRASGDQADPVNSADGSYTESDVDASVANVGYPMSVHRTYNSLDTKSGVLGKGWSWDYEAKLTFPDGSHTTFVAGDGQRVKYTLEDGSWVRGTGVTADLTDAGGGYQIVTRADVTYRFDGNGVLQSIKDRNGQGVTLTHNGSGQVTQAAGSGRSIAFDYTTGGLLHTATLPDGRDVEYGYTDGQLTSVTDLAGQDTTYGYDGQDRLTSQTNAAQVTTMRLAYDPTTGRVSDQWDARNHHTTFAWDPVEQAATETDPNGGRWIDDYANGALFARVDPKGRCTFYDFNSNWQLTDMVDPRGNESTYHYDDHGNLTATRNQTGRVTTSYNNRHDPVDATNAKGVDVHYDYDSSGNLTTLTTTSYTTGPNGAKNVVDQVYSNQFTYWPNGEVKTAQDARGYQTSYAYDSNGDLTDVTSPEGRHVHYGYDTLGRRTAVVDPCGYDTGNTPADYTTTISYTPRDQVKVLTDPLGHTTTYAYDPQVGRLTSLTDANQHTTSYDYYDDGRVKTVTQPGTQPGSPAAVTSYTYDDDNNLATVTDADNRVVTYHYDAANEPTSQDTPLGTYTYSYDNDGRVVSTKKPGDTAATTYTLNPRGNVLAINYPGGSGVAYSYDIHGQPKSMVNHTSSGTTISSTTYTHNDYDQLTAVATTTNGQVTNYGYTYDADGNLTNSTGPGGPRGYSYDHDGLLTSVAKAGDDIADYTYTSAGGPKTASYGDGSHQTFGYDKAGRLTSHTDTTTAGTAIVDDDYGLDDVGNPTTITHYAPAGDTTDTYTYNARNQLTGVCYDNTSPTCAGATDYITWAYDPVGNRTQETRPAGTTSYSYDATTGHLSSTTGPNGTTTYTYNNNGELTGDGTTSYTYNPDTTVATQTTDSTGTATDYTYDGDGRRITTQIGDTGTPDTITHHDWDPQTYQPTAELDGNNTLLRDYSYGLGPIGYSTTTGSGANSYLHTDLQGSITTVTGPDGALDATTSYEPYGLVKTHQTLDDTAPVSPLGWEGQYTDPDGQSNLRARLYNPTLGAFSSPDPAQATTASATYTYPANPMTQADPTGLDPLDGLSGMTHLNPIPSVENALGAAWRADQACFGGKGGCGSAVLNAYLSGMVAAAAVIATAAVIYGLTVATDGIADALILDGLEETAGAEIAGELGSEFAGEAAGFAEEAADTAAEVGEGAARSPSFIVKPNGETVIVPNGAEGPFPVESGKGFMFRGGSGGHGLSDAASDVRIMDPVTGGKYPKPNGYASYLNGGGQTINPFTGQTVGKADSWWHWVFGP